MNVYTGGTFDLFHVGHVRLLARCRDLAGGGTVTVALNRDEFVERFKGHPPVVPYAARAEVLRACRYVDAVVVNEADEDSRPTISRVAPDVIAVGSDWADRDYEGQLGLPPGWLAERGIALVYLPYTDGVSTTVLRAWAAA